MNLNDHISLMGYQTGSPYAGNPYLDIHTPEGLIDMSNTPIDLIGIDNRGNKKRMKAGRKNPYRFEGDIVREIPLQEGGQTIPYHIPHESSEKPILKRITKSGKFKALIPLEDWDDDFMNYTDKIKFVKRGGKEYIKLRGKYIPPPPVDDIEAPHFPVELQRGGINFIQQDNLRQQPLYDAQQIAYMKTPEYKQQVAATQASQKANMDVYTQAKLRERKAAIDKSNTEGGFKNSAIAEKMRLFPESAGGWGEVFDDYINLPRILIGESADRLGHAKTAKEYAAAIATPIAIGATGYSPLSTAQNIARSPVTQAIASTPERIYNSFVDGGLKDFNATQKLAPIVDDVTYNSLRNINKAGNIFKNESIPFDQRVNRLIKMDIPEEQVIKLTGKTRQELLQEANEFANIKKTALETGEPVRSNGTIDLTRPNRRPRPSQNLTPEELAIAEQQRIIDNLPASEQNEYYRNLVNTLPESRFNLTRGNGLSVDEIRQRIQQNINQNAYYNEFDIQQYLTGQRSTPQMAQMQKANNINSRVDKFINSAYGKKFSKKYIPAYDEIQEVSSLIPSITRAMTSDVEGVIKQNLSKVSGANRGDLFRGATSLSDGSFPAYMRNIQREAQRGVGEPIFGGYQELNSMGFLKQAGVTNEQTAGYLNKYITDFNKTTGKNIPKAYIENDRVQYPDIIFKKLKKGGNPYQKGGNVYDFLFGDDEEIKTSEVSQVPEEQSQTEEQSPVVETPDSDYELALMIANRQWDNAPEQEFATGNPYNIETSNGLSEFGKPYSDLDANVTAATRELLAKFPNLRLTSGRRNWGDKDAHPKGRAVDLSYDQEAYKYYKNVIVPKYGFNPALNPNHGTGQHIHLGYY